MTGPTINQVMDAYQSVRAKTVSQPERLHYSFTSIRRLLGDRPAADYGQDLADEYIAARAAEGVKPQTASRELQCLRAGVRLAKLPAPTLILPPQGKPRIRVLTQDEAVRLTDAARDPRMKLYIALGLSTGARRGALCDLTWDRVDLERRIIDLRAPHPRADSRKGRAVVPISEALAEMLAEIRPPSGEGEVLNLTASAVNYHFRVMRTKAGLGQDITPHVLRHTAASIMVKSVPLIMASKMLGHSNTKITESVYVHLLADDLRPAADATAALLPPMPRRRRGAVVVQRLRRWWSGLVALIPRPARPKPQRKTPSRKRRAKRKPKALPPPI